MKHAFILASLFLVGTSASLSQNGKIKLSGSIQTDWLAAENDDAIGANKNDYRGDILGNTYIQLNLDSKYITAGLRFETMEKPLPGYELFADAEPFYGTGLPYFQITASNHKWIEATVGTFYEQFGSGFILRTYEERSLGIDNSILGGRLVLNPLKGLRLKMLGGVQRYHFAWNTDNPVFGVDAEINFDQWFSRLQDKNHYLTFGIGAVMRHSKENLRQYPALEIGRDSVFNDLGQLTAINTTMQNFSLQMPENVTAMDMRMQWQHNGFNVLTEYAVKSQDPSNNFTRFDDGTEANYIYRHGNALMLAASYSQKGFSAQFMAKRSEDMGFRSDRNLSPLVSSLYLNHQPAFAYQHTYSLCSLYPYATQMDGEWAFQADLSYRFKRGTTIGGKYGTLLRLNFSHIRGLDKQPVAMLNLLPKYAGTKGYTASFFGMTDDVYYQDINLTMEKKLNKKWKLTAMYMYQIYNQEIIEAHGNIVKSHILVGDASWTHSRNLALRIEAQYLNTKQDKGDWAYAGIEVSFLKHWMISLADQYNTGLNGGTDTHYFTGAAVWTLGSSRLQLGYGRTREGLNCTGGVCRTVPAQRGVTMSWNYNF